MSSHERYPVPARRLRVEEVERRSRFIATVGPAPAIDAAEAFIDEVRAEFGDATHNCWAYVVGPPGSTRQVGMSDDGEPHGTAGKPMLNVLLHSGVGDVVAVVTRYFGGTKLGTGGLVRAYGGIVQRALERLPTSERIDYLRVDVLVDYPAADTVDRLVEEYEARVLDTSYTTDVLYRLEIPVGRLDRFRSALMQLTRGAAVMRGTGGD